MVYWGGMNTKIFLDSGNPEETKSAKERLGFLDGQTTNPSLVAKNPNIVALKDAHALNEGIIWDEYKKIAIQIHEIIPHGAISVEVFSDRDTSHDEMIAKAKELNQWFPGIYVKLPTTHEGLLAARELVGEDINVNMTLCFSQEQAAAIHDATMGARPGQIFVSPFIGRLDDIGYQGIHLVRNIMMMYDQWNSHVTVLAASIRTLGHVCECLSLGVGAMTAPLSVLDTWATYGVTKSPKDYPLEISENKPIPYMDLPKQDWVLYNITHELTEKGIDKFVSDWKGLFA